MNIIKNARVNPGQPAPARRARAGFTLIELLVVIAIIAILAAMLLPALATAKTRAQSLYCMNNFSEMMKSCFMYTGDNHEFFPPNPDDGAGVTAAGYEWVCGDVGGWMPSVAAGGSPDAGDTQELTDDQYSLLAPYMGHKAGSFKCPADPRVCIYNGLETPVVRSCSCNQGVGTCDTSWMLGMGHKGVPNVRVPGGWLTGTHNDSTYSQYATFGKTTDFKVASPSDIFVYVDESPWSINDAGLAVSAAVPEFVDYPSYMHRGACGFAFADGHSEIHKWKGGALNIHGTPGITTVTLGSADGQDWYWLAWHASRNNLTGKIP